MVGSAAADFVFDAGFERADLGTGVLRPGFLLQLSALHGDDLSRLPPGRGLREVPRLHSSHNGAGGADAVPVACLGSDAAVDLHDLRNVESMALQRAKLRPDDDV